MQSSSWPGMALPQKNKNKTRLGSGRRLLFISNHQCAHWLLQILQTSGPKPPRTYEPKHRWKQTSDQKSFRLCTFSASHSFSCRCVCATVLLSRHWKTNPESQTGLWLLHRLTETKAASGASMTEEVTVLEVEVEVEVHPVCTVLYILWPV